MSSRRFFIVTVLMVLLGMAALNGCSSFRASRKLDMAPFSENTGVFFAEAAKVATPFQFKYLAQYVSPELQQEGRAKAMPIINAIRGIVYYSNQVVAINNSALSEADKNRQLARYLEDVLKQSTDEARLDSIGLGAENVRTIIEKVRTAQTYLEGIDAAGPVVNAIVVAIQEGLDEIQQKLIPEIVAELDGAIEVEYAPGRKIFMDMKDLQARSMSAINLLYRARIGDPRALDTLLAEDPSLREFIASPEKATAKGLSAAEQYLFDRLTRIDTMIHQLDLDASIYRAKKNELVEYRNDADARIRIARNAVAVWAQSHRSLGAGVLVPPVINVGGIASGLVGEAQKAVF